LIDEATFEACKVLRGSMRDGVPDGEVGMDRVLDTLVRSIGFLYVVVGAATGADHTALGTPVPRELRASLDAAKEDKLH